MIKAKEEAKVVHEKLQKMGNIQQMILKKESLEKELLWCMVRDKYEVRVNNSKVSSLFLHGPLLGMRGSSWKN